MADIARQAGVSKNTVSLALRHDRQIPPATQKRIERIAARLGYRKDPVVAQLMARLRGKSRYKATLALLNANLDARALTRHPTIPEYVRGIRRRAEELGYGLDEFWLHDAELDGKRLNRIFEARGIRGAVVLGLMKENRLPARFLPTWAEFPCVVTGVRTHEPTLSFACTDHHALAANAFAQALALGYRRPALVLDPVIDRLVEGRFSAGVLIAQQVLPARQRTRALYWDSADNPKILGRWLDREKPDAILTLYHSIRERLAECGVKAPRDLGLIQLEWRPRHSEWAGMNQHNDVVGAAAIDMVAGQIVNGQKGVPVFPQATLIGSTWVDGATVAAGR